MSQQQLLDVAAKQLLSDRDSNLVRALDEDLTRKYKELTTDYGYKKKVMLNILLDTEERERLTKYYPEFEITYNQSNLYSHGYAAASKKMEQEILLCRGTSGTEPVVDIGGNWADHILSNRHHIHGCCPLLDIRDSARKTEREERVKRVYISKMKNPTLTDKEKQSLAVYRYFHDPQANFYCSNLAQECTHKARYGIALHSIYDIKFEDLGKIMDAHGMDTLHGTFIFFPAILQSGNDKVPLESKELKVVAIKDSKKNTIEFTFKTDSSNAYKHDLKNYLKYLTRTFFTNGASLFYYELMENRGGIQFFKAIRIKSIPRNPINRQSKYIWMGNDEIYAVKVYEYANISKRLNQKEEVREISVDYVFVNKLTYERSLEYALGVNKEGNTLFDAIYSYMRSINNRIIVSGINVTTPERVSADTLFKLAVAIYAHTNFLKYCGNQIRDRLDKQLKNYFSLLKKGFFSLFAEWAKEALTGGNDKLHDTLIGPFRLAILKRMDAIKNQPDYKMQDFFLRFEDYVNVNLQVDIQLFRDFKRDAVLDLMDYYSSIPFEKLSPTIKSWIKSRVNKFNLREILRYRPLIEEIELEVLSQSSRPQQTVELPEATASTSTTLPKIPESEQAVFLRKDDSTPEIKTISCKDLELIVKPTVAKTRLETIKEISVLNDLTGSEIPIPKSFKDTFEEQYQIKTKRPKKSKVKVPKWLVSLVRLGKSHSEINEPLVKTEVRETGSERGDQDSMCVTDESVSEVDPTDVEDWVNSTLKCAEDQVDAVNSTLSTVVDLDQSFETVKEMVILPELLNVDFESLPGFGEPKEQTEVKRVRFVEPGKTECSLGKLPVDKGIDPSLRREIDDSIREYIEYVKAEMASNTAVGERLWSSMIGIITRTPNIHTLAASYKSHEAALLTRHVGKTFKVYKPPVSAMGMACGEYDMAFDGKNFIKLTYRKEGFEDFFECDSDSEWLLVWKDTRLLQCSHIIRAIEGNPFVRNYSCKRILVEGVPGCGKTTEIINRAGPSDLILTVARKTREEIQEKLERMNKRTKVRTVDSYLLNDRSVYDRVFLDEGLMIHAGMVHVIASYSGCQELLIFGDRNQLNFTCRVAQFEPRYHIFRCFSSYEMRNTSYRCPKDVARLFSGVYEGGFSTTNTVTKSLFSKEIRNIGEVDTGYSKYLTFNQDEKKQLERAGFTNVNTIHESQGTTYKTVALVRLNFKTYDIYSKMKYVLVGLTRHTTKLTYFTVKPGDLVDSMIKGLRTPSRVDMEESRSDADRVFKGSETLELTSKEVVKEFKPCEGDVSQLRTLLLQNPFFLESTGVSHNDQLVAIEQATTSKHKVEPTKRKKAVIEALQDYYDSVLPYASTEYTEHDEYQIQTGDLNLALEDVKISLARDGEKTQKMLKDTTEYLPELRTGQPNKRSSNLRQAALAIMKRNCDTPRNALPSNIKELFSKTLTSFQKLFMRPDSARIFEEFRREPVALTREGIEEWLTAQEPSKLKRINLEEDFLSVETVVKYMMMVKNQAKNKLEPGGVMEYQSPQNIVYHSPTVNAVFGPMFKLLYQRFIRLLNANVCVMLRKSHEDLEVHMNTFLDPNKHYYKLEIDFSKFDKSQTEVCFEIEMAFWELLGMDQMLLDYWKIGHYNVTATDFQAGIKAYLQYQRKSGDSATAFGNTIISMCTLAYATAVPSVCAAYFIGDDSLIFLDRPLNHSAMPDVLSKTFNLSSKILEMNTGYFCSMFIIQHVDGFKVVPDPLKRIEKLGSKISVNDIEDLRQRYISFRELIDVLGDDSLIPLVAQGMDERYGPSPYTEAALRALRIAASDFRIFATLYRKVVC